MSGSKAFELSGTSIILLFVITACSGGGGGGNSNKVEDGASITAVSCTTTVNDSVDNSPNAWTRIHSENNGNPEYYSMQLARQSTITTSNPISIDYMVHPSVGTAKALLVLIAGGALDAGITGANTVPPSAPTTAGGNFVVRSAHLFAAQGYKVLTVDRPSDFDDYLNGSTAGYLYDTYRQSVAHAVDLSEVINTVNETDNLPVILVGTSRGAISAVLQYQLAAALALSSPVTTGNATPVSNTLADKVTIPVQLSWHTKDGCGVTKPADNKVVLDEFPEAVGVAISGGFSNPGADVCNGDSYHGFPGIESCAVQQTTDWIAKLEQLQKSRPLATAQNTFTGADTLANIDLAGAASASNGGNLTYALPFATTSLGGTISISGTLVTYTPPPGISGLNDTFAYIVKEQNGGSANNIVSVTINP